MVNEEQKLTDENYKFIKDIIQASEKMNDSIQKS